MPSVGEIRVNGTNEVKFEAAALSFDPWRGMSSTHRAFAPLNTPGLLDLMSDVITAGGSGKMLFATDDPVLEYELPGLPWDLVGIVPELFFDRWDLVANESLDSIFINPRMVDTVNFPASAMNYNDRVVISRFIRDNSITIDDAIAACNADLATGALHAPAPGPGTYGGGTVDNKFQGPIVASAAGQAYRESLKGQFEYEAPSHVLTHCSVCSPTSTYNTGRANELCIYTPAQLLTEISSGWTYNCPLRLRSEISALPSKVAAPDEATYYTWGWLKKITRSSPQTNFMIEVSTEYILGLWSNIKYGLAV